MHCLNYRIGVLFRQNLAKKSYQMRYFFIDDEANLFYISSLARLQKIIRLSSDFKEIKGKLVQIGQKSFSLHKYTTGVIRNYHSEAVLPFSNRTCFDIKQKQSKEEKGYQLFGFIDDDTSLLLDQILKLTGKKKPIQLNKRKSVIEQEKDKQEKRTLQFFQKYIKNQQKFMMKNISAENKQIQFQGDMDSTEANGKCVETLLSQNITYTGYFKDGKKNGAGLLVNETLDSFQCIFIDDELVGI